VSQRLGPAGLGDGLELRASALSRFVAFASRAELLARRVSSTNDNTPFSGPLSQVCDVVSRFSYVASIRSARVDDQSVHGTSPLTEASPPHLSAGNKSPRMRTDPVPGSAWTTQSAASVASAWKKRSRLRLGRRSRWTSGERAHQRRHHACFGLRSRSASSTWCEVPESAVAHRWLRRLSFVAEDLYDRLWTHSASRSRTRRHGASPTRGALSAQQLRRLRAGSSRCGVGRTRSASVATNTKRWIPRG
jgi:hypothetical protein